MMRKMLTSLFVAFSLIVVSSPVCANSFDDDFDGSTIDKGRWTIWGGWPQIVSNKLNVNNNGSIITVGLRSDLKWYLSGAFDVQVDFDSFSTSGSGDGGIYLDLSFNDINDYITFGRRVWGDYYCRTLIGGNSDYALAITSATSGKLRVVRSGTTITAYYYNAGWVQLFQKRSFTSNEMRVFVYSLAYPGRTINANFDNFQINSGTVVLYDNCVADYNGDDNVDTDDLFEKQYNINQLFQDWVNQCWLPGMNCQ